MQCSDMAAGSIMIKVRRKLDTAEVPDDAASFALATLIRYENDLTARRVLVFEVFDHGSWRSCSRCQLPALQLGEPSTVPAIHREQGAPRALSSCAFDASIVRLPTTRDPCSWSR